MVRSCGLGAGPRRHRQPQSDLVRGGNPAVVVSSEPTGSSISGRLGARHTVLLRSRVVRDPPPSERVRDKIARMTRRDTVE